jgi:glycolate oxidase FAD binding subunit
MATLFREASARGWRVLPAGAGSWLGGWGIPEVDLVVSTIRLDGMGVYEPADLTFTAGAGMPITRLREATAAHGQWLPLDPPGARRGTLGALVSTGVAGPLRLAYGSPRDHVLGLTLVSGDGRILRWGGRVVKNVAGFDVTRLSIGSRGTLGIITSVSARLFPLPREDRTVLVTGDSSEALLPTARELAFSSMPLAAVEILERDSKAGAILVVRLLGTLEELGEMERRIRDAAKGAGRKILAVLEGGESRAFHEELEAWEDGASLVCRLALLPSRTDALLARTRELRGLLGLEGGAEMARALHVGWGVARVAVRGEIPAGGNPEAVSAGLSALRKELEGEGGSLLVSQGPGDLLQALGGRRGSGGGVDPLVAGLKKTFDPAGILVPGRLET